jgi:hypothetical protein
MSTNKYKQVHALERLQGLGDDKAGQYVASITRFVFVIALVVSEHILPKSHNETLFSTFKKKKYYSLFI